MEFDVNAIQDLSLIIFLVVLNGAFVATEFAMVRINPVHFTNQEGRRKVGSKTTMKLLERMELALASVQLGITVASILLGWFGVQILYELLSQLLSSAAGMFSSEYISLVLMIISLASIIFLHVVIGELSAKSIAVRYPEMVLRLLSAPVFLFVQGCRPIIYVLNRSADLFLRILRIDRSEKVSRAQSLAELSFLVSKSTEGGLLEEEEEQMLRGVFGLSDTVAREIMTPRTDLITISTDSTFDEVLATIRESGLSRFPVTGESIDDVQGVLLARDILNFVVPGVVNGSFKREEFSVKKLVREAYFIPGTKPIDDLLTEFKRRKLHLGIVLDEHGGVDGVVTLEDLLEEIVGDIFDESDIPQKSIVVQENGDVLIDGGQLVADLNTQFGLEIPEGDYDTIAGFIFTSLGRMPRPGDTISVNKAHAAVLAAAVEEAASETVGETETTGEEEAPQLPAQAVITVEKVQSYRIETVRLRQSSEVENSESLPRLLSSNSQERASDQ